MVVISLRNVNKFFGSFHALKDVSFDIKEGEIVGFLGQNGAGKTTTMRIITGFMGPTSGEVMVNGVDILENPKVAKQSIGYLPEHPPLYLNMTVKDYLSFVGELKGLKGNYLKERVAVVIEQTGLVGKENLPIAYLSKGYRQRVGIAQSIVNNPQILILDEPTIGLDPIQVIEVRNLIKKLVQELKKTVILSTHILPEVNMIARRVIIIHKGRIVADGNIEELTGKIQEKLSFSVNIEKEHIKKAEEIIRSIEGVEKVEVRDEKIFVEADAGKDPRPKVLKALLENNINIKELRKEEKTLEEIFVELTTKE